MEGADRHHLAGRADELNDAVHGWGGITLHDIIDDRFARKAIEKGADGLIAVAAGAGGHAGRWSPFALVQEIRKWFDGPLALSGAIATGGAILAAQAMGADLAYIGSPFIATDEARATDDYKQAIVEGGAADIVNSDSVHRHPRQLPARVDRRRRASIPTISPSAGARGDELPVGDRGQSVARHLGFGPGHRRGRQVVPTADLIARLAEEYAEAKARSAARRSFQVSPPRLGNRHRPAAFAIDLDMGEMALRRGRGRARREHSDAVRHARPAEPCDGKPDLDVDGES